MQKDLVTAIVAGVIGIVAAYLVTSIFIGEIEPYTFPAVESSFSTEIQDPNPDVFNYRAINPTVEVYVNGNCEPNDEECIINNGGNNGTTNEENPGEF